MAYIGKTPVVGNFQVCDAISVVNGQAAYTLQVGSANVIPESANHMIVSLNGVIQKPGSSFTVSGSTMTFASNLATGDSIDFVQILGNVLDIGTPSDATVTTAKLANSAVDLTSKVTGALPVANGGTNLTSGFANGITMADAWRLTADTGNATTDITANWERNDEASYGSIGTGLTESSGIFSFPSTGIYLIHACVNLTVAGGDTGGVGVRIQSVIDGASNDIAVMTVNNRTASSESSECSINHIYDVPDTSTHKFKFRISSADTGSVFRGNTAQNETHFSVIRLGDT